MLSEAGYPDGFQAVINLGMSPQADRGVEIMLPLLEQIGIKAKLRTLERTAMYASMDNGDFEMGALTPGLNIEDPNDYLGTMYITGAGRNYSRFSDAVVDELYQKQSREMDHEKRKQLVRQLEDRLVEMVPVIILSQDSSGLQMRYPYVKGYKPVGGRYQEQRREHIWMDK